MNSCEGYTLNTRVTKVQQRPARLGLSCVTFQIRNTLVILAIPRSTEVGWGSCVSWDVSFQRMEGNYFSYFKIFRVDTFSIVDFWPCVNCCMANGKDMSNWNVPFWRSALVFFKSICTSHTIPCYWILPLLYVYT